MDTQEALQQRIQMARSEDQVLGLFYEYTVECMGELFGPEAVARGRAAVAGPGGWMGFFRYPVAGLLRLMDAGLDEGEPRTLVYGQALERVGQATARRFLGSPLGRAYTLVAGREPHGALNSTMSSAKVSATYGERGYEWLGPQRARLFFQHEMLGPSWIQGFYAEGIRLLTGLQMEVRLTDEQGPGTDFCLLFSW